MKRKGEAIANAAIAPFKNEHNNMVDKCARESVSILLKDEARLRECEDLCGHFSAFFCKTDCSNVRARFAANALVLDVEMNTIFSSKYRRFLNVEKSNRPRKRKSKRRMSVESTSGYSSSFTERRLQAIRGERSFSGVLAKPDDLTVE